MILFTTPEFGVFSDHFTDIFSLICLVIVLQDKPNSQNDECCSYTSSNRESWGRCSSLGGSDEESSADCTAAENGHQVLSLSLLCCVLGCNIRVLCLCDSIEI